MKKRHTVLIVLMVVAAAAVLATLCFAQQQEAWGLLRNPKMKEKLGITDEQLNALRSAWFETRKKTIDLESKLRVARLEIEEALEKEPVDKKVIEKKVDEIAAIKADFLRATINQRIVMKETLKPEQREQLRQILGERLRQIREKRDDIRGAADRFRNQIRQQFDRPQLRTPLGRPRADAPPIGEPCQQDIGLGELESPEPPLELVARPRSLGAEEILLPPPPAPDMSQDPDHSGLDDDLVDEVMEEPILD